MSESDVMEDHFWWRPGWAPDRPYLTWHVLPGADLTQAVRVVQDRLGTLDHLAVVPADRLHITGPGVGFADEISTEGLTRLVERTRESLNDRPPFTVEVGAPVAGRGGVFIALASPEFVDVRKRLRTAVRAAGVEPPGTDHEQYRPHLTLAYAAGPASRRAAADRLEESRWTRQMLHVDAVHLLALRMVPPGYDWHEVATVHLHDQGSRPRHL